MMYEKTIVILGVLLTCAGGLNASDLILNEYNAVGGSKWLDCDGLDCSTCGGPPCKRDSVVFGRIEGNGGNWIELVVTRDHLDIRGWQLDWTEETPAPDPADAGTLTLTDDPLWADLQAGTIITFIEFDTVVGGLDTDTSFDPDAGDWWININTLKYDGTPHVQYVTTTTNVDGDGPGNFSVGNDNWQLTIRDAESNVVFGPCGEGAPGETAQVSSREVFKLEEDPSPDIHPVDSRYRSGTSSSFGHPNIWGGGDNQQDFGFLRCSDGVYCNGAENYDAELNCQAGSDPCPGQMCDEDNDLCGDCLSDDDCDNGLYCDGPETCDASGNCQPGADPCAAQMCHENDDACVECLAQGDCDDALYCNGAETCDANGHCQSGTRPCAGRLCDDDSDVCFKQGCSTDGDCDDALYCNGVETCVGGFCQAGTHVDCDDSLGCTDDSCDEGADSCDNTPGDANCDNGLFCDGAETCDPLLGCQAGSDPCPDQTCDEEAGLCMDCLSNGDCNDGEFCNGDETCQDGVCTDGDRPCPDLGHCDELDDVCLACIAKGECDDGSPCTDDACLDNVCVNTAVPDDTSCSDGEFCNGDETCQDGVCTDGDQPCADLDHCDEVNAGCDDDGDGVVNPFDECADTPAGAKVDDTGCTITLPEEPAGAELPTGDDGDTDAPPSNGQDAGGSGSGGGSGSCGIIGLVSLAFIFMGLMAMRFARRSRA